MGLLSFLLAFVLVSADSTNNSVLLNQSKSQAKHYIAQTQMNRDPELHLWALAQLCESNSEVSDFIDQLSKSEDGFKLPFKPFCDGRSYSELIEKLAFETHSPDLFIAALISKSSADSQQKLRDRYIKEVGFPDKGTIQYQELSDRIIQDQAIDGQILPHEPFVFLHFLLLYNYTPLWNGILSAQYIEKSSSIWSSSGSSFQVSNLRHSIFKAALLRALYITDEYSKINELDFSFVQDKFFPVSNMRLSIYSALDYSLYRLGYYDKSLEISRTASVPLARFFNQKEIELNDLMRQGAYLIKIGKMEEAQNVNLQILEQLNQYENINIPRSSLYTNLGVTYVKTGNFDKYIDLQFRALEEAKEKDNYSHQLLILNNLYIYYRQNNDPNTALLYLEEANRLANQYGSREDIGVIYTYLGTFHKKFNNDYSRSLEYFNKAKAILNAENHFNNYLNMLYEKGKLSEEIEDYGQAINNYESIISLSRDKSIKHFFEALVHKAAVHLKLGELEQASQLISDFTSYDFSQFDFHHIVKAKTVQADYLAKTGHPDKAYALLKPAIQQTVEWARNSTDLQSGFWNVQQEFLDAFQLSADLLIGSGRLKEAVEVLDRLKTINDAALYQNPMVKASLLSETELSQYQRLTNQLNALRKQLLAADPDGQIGIQTRIDQFSARKRALDRKITTMANRKLTTIAEVQHSLSAYEAVLHITELNDWYYIATIFRNDVHLKKVRLDSSLRSVFARSSEQLASGKTNLNDLYQISEVLGLKDLPSWTNKLTVIPDSYLYQLPIDILPLTRPGSAYSYGGTTYLIERFSTHYLTSLNDFNMPVNERKNYKWDFIGYGVSNFESYTGRNLVPLPYAQTEVSNIMAGLTNISDKTALLDSSSSEEAFKATAGDARILHLATHSEVSEHDPLFSSIYVSQHGASPEGDFPGQIFAYELFELNLANDLIMLNSCESGSGSYLQGSGIMGISRALRYAGANSLVLNLWSVNDMMASEFAVHFYSNLNEGKTKAEALRSAKLHMLKTNNANPHYWGTYILIGKNNAVINPLKKANIYLASTFILYFIILTAISIVKERKRKKLCYSR